MIGMKNIPGKLSVFYHGFGYNSNNPFSLVENIMNQGFIAGRRQTYANSPDIRHHGRIVDLELILSRILQKMGNMLVLEILKESIIIFFYV